MKIALLGCDDHSLRIAGLASRDERFEIISLADIGDRAGELLRLCPGAKVERQWETLTLSSEAHLVFAADDERPLERKLEQLKRLIVEGVPVLAAPPLADPVDLYELEMLRVEHETPLAPYIAGRANHGFQRLAELVRRPSESGGDGLGKASHIEISRVLTQRDDQSARRQLAADIRLMRTISSFDSITATGPPTAQSDASLMSVHLADAEGRYVQWGLTSAESGGQSVIKLAGEQKAPVLTMPGWDQPWELSIPGDPSFEAVSGPPDDELATALTEFADRRGPRWIEACQAAELVAAAKKSLARGRTVRLNLASEPEEQQFKSVMAAGGCVVLMLALFAFCVAAVVDGMNPPFRNAWWWRLWPMYVFFPVVVFVLMQVLQRVVASGSSEN